MSLAPGPPGAVMASDGGGGSPVWPAGSADRTGPRKAGATTGKPAAVQQPSREVAARRARRRADRRGRVPADGHLGRDLDVARTHAVEVCREHRARQSTTPRRQAGATPGASRSARAAAHSRVATAWRPPRVVPPTSARDGRAQTVAQARGDERVTLSTASRPARRPRAVNDRPSQVSRIERSRRSLRRRRWRSVSEGIGPMWLYEGIPPSAVPCLPHQPRHEHHAAPMPPASRTMCLRRHLRRVEREARVGWVVERVRERGLAEWSASAAHRSRHPGQGRVRHLPMRPRQPDQAPRPGTTRYAS